MMMTITSIEHAFIS